MLGCPAQYLTHFSQVGHQYWRIPAPRDVSRPDFKSDVTPCTINHRANRRAVTHTQINGTGVAVFAQLLQRQHVRAFETAYMNRVDVLA